MEYKQIKILTHLWNNIIFVATYLTKLTIHSNIFWGVHFHIHKAKNINLKIRKNLKHFIKQVVFYVHNGGIVSGIIIIELKHAI